MKLQHFVLFTAVLLALTFNPAVSFAAAGNPEALNISGQNMDMPEHAMTNNKMDMKVHSMPGHSMGEKGGNEMPDMPGHTKDMSDQDMNMPEHNSALPQENPSNHVTDVGHGSYNPGAGSEVTEVNRAGLLGGLGLLNGFIILSAAIMRKKTAPLEGGSSNEK